MLTHFSTDGIEFSLARCQIYIYQHALHRLVVMNLFISCNEFIINMFSTRLISFEYTISMNA